MSNVTLIITQAPTTATTPVPTTTQTPQTCQPETAAPTTQAPTTTTTTTELCQEPVPITTTTVAPTTTEYVWITQPVCGCQPQFVGDRCEQPVTQTAAATRGPTTTPAPTAEPGCIPEGVSTVATTTVAPAMSYCASVSCLNGGSCIEVSVFPFAVCK